MTFNYIVSAPSKFDLLVAFFDRPNPEKLGDRRSVNFTIEGRSCPNSQRQIKIEVVINSLSWEEGSGESWVFEGYCRTNIGQPQNWTLKVKGWFRTTDRRGWIDIDDSSVKRAPGDLKLQIARVA